MPKIKVKGQTVQTGERPQTNGQTHGHCQTYYLSCNMVDKDSQSKLLTLWTFSKVVTLSFSTHWQTHKAFIVVTVDSKHWDTEVQYFNMFNCIFLWTYLYAVLFWHCCHDESWTLTQHLCEGRIWSAKLEHVDNASSAPTLPSACRWHWFYNGPHSMLTLHSPACARH